jgi:hypothetical protein
MITRPYSNLSVVELEKLFQRSRTDEEVLAGLLAELSQRSTNRAARLRASVLEAGEAAQKSRAPEVPTRTEGTESAKSSPATPTVGSARSWRSLPPIRDRAEDILSAWIALDPSGYRDPTRMGLYRRRLVSSALKRRKLQWCFIGREDPCAMAGGLIPGLVDHDR